MTIAAVGKLKEDYLRAASAEYQKRLTPMCRLRILEIEEYRLPSDPSPAQIEAGLQAEGRRILEKLSGIGCVIPLCIEGKLLSSPELSQQIGRFALSGDSQIAFVIGGSYGLSEEVKAAGRLRLSMSPMTFPHQLARVMLLEQLYRALSIQNHTRYHK